MSKHYLLVRTDASGVPSYTPLTEEALVERFAERPEIMHFAACASIGECVETNAGLLLRVSAESAASKVHTEPWEPTEEEWAVWSEWARIHRSC